MSHAFNLIGRSAEKVWRVMQKKVADEHICTKAIYIFNFACTQQLTFLPVCHGILRMRNYETTVTSFPQDISLYTHGVLAIWSV